MHILKASYSKALTVSMTVLSPFLEKNPLKILAVNAPVVISMNRIVLAAMSYAMYHRLRINAPLGWPDCTLAVFIVVGPTLVDALNKVSPEAVVAFGEAIVGRLGVGEVAKWRPNEWADGKEDGLL